MPGFESHRRPSTNKGVRKPWELYTPLEIYRLLEACDWSSPSEHRLGAMIAVMYRSGLTPGETRHLRSRDIDSEQLTVRALAVPTAQRIVGIDRTAMRIVDGWRRRAGFLGYDSAGPLFTSKTGRTLSKSTVSAQFQQLGRKAKLEKRCHAAALRNTFSYELSMEGTPINVIQAALGHACLTSTSRYLSRLAPVDTIKRIRSRTWQPPAAALEAPPTLTVVPTITDPVSDDTEKRRTA